MTEYPDRLAELIEFAKTHDCENLSSIEECEALNIMCGLGAKDSFDLLSDLYESAEGQDPYVADQIVAFADTLNELLNECDWSEPDPYDIPDDPYPDYDY